MEFFVPPQTHMGKAVKKGGAMLCATTTSGKAVKKINESPTKKPQFGEAGEGHAL